MGLRLVRCEEELGTPLMTRPFSQLTHLQSIAAPSQHQGQSIQTTLTHCSH